MIDGYIITSLYSGYHTVIISMFLHQIHVYAPTEIYVHVSAPASCCLFQISVIFMSAYRLTFHRVF